tara:strand:+ start:1437 stop:2411 length:975 start_codon:yes stop_codon:yes gene_type:complete
LEIINMSPDKILVTGCSGFIGMHLCENLLRDGTQVFGIDNMNDYYDVTLKKSRLKNLLKYNNFEFEKVDISNFDELMLSFKKFKPTKVVNLAAQAGVRYSLKNPHAYIKTNVMGFMNVLECCRNHQVRGLIYASSSSVYGGNIKSPFSVDDEVNKPISIYAASKKSNELMAYTYNHLYGLKSTGLRFFTVYGPWGRPDMAMYIFLNKINNGEEIKVFNHGDMQRDFTYIDDIISGIKSSIKKNYSYEIFNLGNNKSENLMDMISAIESCLKKKAKIKYLDMQPGDVKKTCADIDYTKLKLGYNPKISMHDGIIKFIDWYNHHSG